MREFLLRGKRLDNGEWYYGSYLFLHVSNCDWTGMRRGPAKDVHFIVDEKDINYAVDPETVGQYTGLSDKNGVRIFEGDIVKFNSPFKDYFYIICYENGAFRFGPYKEVFTEKFAMDHEVAGNIYDNFELLESV